MGRMGLETILPVTIGRMLNFDRASDGHGVGTYKQAFKLHNFRGKQTWLQGMVRTGTNLWNIEDAVLLFILLQTSSNA